MAYQPGISKSDNVIVEAASDVAATRQELIGRIGALRARLESLNGAWQGRGQLAFQGAITAWQGTADRVVGALDDFGAQLHGSEATYDESEDVVASALNRYQSGLAG